MCNSLLLMTASLAFLSIVRALSIDNQLTVIRNDCYERLAIQQRLSPADVYQSFNFTKLEECRMACTQEKNFCKAFSFGISGTGNGTCELSFNSVKETADLKPVGTELDTDFDLYIKKLGCSIVIDKTPHTKPVNEAYPPSGKPDTLGNIKPLDSGYEYKPLENEYDKPKKPDYHYLPTKHDNKDPVEHVQTHVSVASGPNTVLHPIYDIIISKKLQQNDDGYGNMPPFRPPGLNHPYENNRPGYHDKPEYYGGKPRPPAPVHENPDLFYDQPAYGDEERPIRPVKRPIDCDPDYEKRPSVMKPQLGYGESEIDRPLRPIRPPFEDDDRPDPIYNNRPNGMKPDMSYSGFSSHSHNSHDLSVSSTVDRYDDLRPQRPYNRPRPKPSRPDIIYMDLHRPIPNKYGSVIPHPNDYSNNGRPPTNDYMFDEGEQGYDNRPPKRPSFYPPPPSPDNDNPNEFYGSPPRPSKPIFSDSQVYDNDKPDRPVKPQSQDNVGVYSYDRPSRPLPPPDYYDKKPTSKPRPNDSGGYDDQPNDFKGSKLQFRPGSSNNGAQGNKNSNGYTNKGSGTKPIVSHSIGNHGEHITSIITELKDGKYFLIVSN